MSKNWYLLIRTNNGYKIKDTFQSKMGLVKYISENYPTAVCTFESDLDVNFSIDTNEFNMFVGVFSDVKDNVVRLCKSMAL